MTEPIKAISPKDLVTYLCLRRARNSKTGEATVPITVLTRKTGASPVTVINSLKRLEELGHITCKRRGRENVYTFVTDINASSYAFLDNYNLTFNEKAAEAVKAAVFNDQPTEESTDVMYGYVVQLEERVTCLTKQVRFLAAELDKLRKPVSAITGQAYVPLTLPVDK